MHTTVWAMLLVVACFKSFSFSQIILFCCFTPFKQLSLVKVSRFTREDWNGVDKSVRLQSTTSCKASVLQSTAK